MRINNNFSFSFVIFRGTQGRKVVREPMNRNRRDSTKQTGRIQCRQQIFCGKVEEAARFCNLFRKERDSPIDVVTPPPCCAHGRLASPARGVLWPARAGRSETSVVQRCRKESWPTRGGSFPGGEPSKIGRSHNEPRGSGCGS